MKRSGGRGRKAKGNGVAGRRVEERCRITLCSIQVNNIYPSAIGEHNGTSNKWVHAAWQDREILVEFYFAASFVIDYTPESPLRCVPPYSFGQHPLLPFVIRFFGFWIKRCSRSTGFWALLAPRAARRLPSGSLRVGKLFSRIHYFVHFFLSFPCTT